MTAPKPGDVLTAEQVRDLPDGAAVETICRYTVTERSAADLAYLASSGENTVTLVSLPTPPDMAPGSVVLDDKGVAWQRDGKGWWFQVGTFYDSRRWITLQPRVVKVGHEAAVTP